MRETGSRTRAEQSCTHQEQHGVAGWWIFYGEKALRRDDRSHLLPTGRITIQGRVLGMHIAVWFPIATVLLAKLSFSLSITVVLQSTLASNDPLYHLLVSHTNVCTNSGIMYIWCWLYDLWVVLSISVCSVVVHRALWHTGLHHRLSCTEHLTSLVYRACSISWFVVFHDLYSSPVGPTPQQISLYIPFQSSHLNRRAWSSRVWLVHHQ